MNPKKENLKVNNVEELSAVYESLKVKFKGIDRANFNFDEEVKNGFTAEEAKAESIKRIRVWWGK